MKTVSRKKMQNIGKSHLIFLIKYAVGSFALFFIAFIMLRYPENSAQGIRNGIGLCINTLIPTLYPFLVISNLFVLSGLVKKGIPFFSKVTERVFRLPGECAGVIFFSMIGGLPVGAKMSLELYKKGVISKNDSRRLICFCVNTGPAFIIGTVGYDMLSSKHIGLIIYISVVLSALTIGFFTRFLAEEDSCFYPKKSRDNIESKNFLHEAVVKSSKSIIDICSWVIIFSCINDIISLFGFSDNTEKILRCVLEVTGGCRTASNYFSVPVVAGVTGFCGVCGHLQLTDSFRQADMKYKHFLVSRIICASLAMVYCDFLMKIFPAAQKTFCAGVKPSSYMPSGSATVSVLMIIMAVLFIVGDDFTVYKKKTKNIKK